MVEQMSESESDIGFESSTAHKKHTVPRLEDYCLPFPPSTRARCNAFRDEHEECETIATESIFPPMLILGAGASFDQHISHALDKVENQDLIHIVINGMKQAEPVSWSLLSKESVCLSSWANAKSVLDPSVANRVMSPLQPGQGVPIDEDGQKAMEKAMNSVCSEEQSNLESFISSNKITRVVVMGYMLDFTIRETITQLKNLPLDFELVLLTARSIAMFPERFDIFPPRGYSSLPRKFGMQTLTDEFALEGVVLDTATNHYLSGVRIV